MTNDVLRALVAKATPGPWVEEDGSVVNRECDLDADSDRMDKELSWDVGQIYHPANLALTVAAVNALPGLLDELDALRKQVAALTGPLAQGWVVPDAKPLPDLMLASYHEAVGWNACRAAMLTGQEGWVMVPVKLTDAIREAGRIDDADWMCIIAAALAAAPPQTGDAPTAAKENEHGTE